MLWESTEPAGALKQRFGFDNSIVAATWVTETLAASWDITVDHCDRIVISGWNAMAWISAGESPLIVKWSAFPKVFPRLKDAASVTVWLHERHIPVARPIQAVDGRHLVDTTNHARGRFRSKLALPGSRFLVGVLPVLGGDLLDTDDNAQVVDAGQMLAAVHDALASYPHPVEGRRPSGDEQLVHNDFRAANLLHDAKAITAVLDLEEITFDTRSADLGKAAVMLATRYRMSMANVMSPLVANESPPPLVVLENRLL